MKLSVESIGYRALGEKACSTNTTEIEVDDKFIMDTLYVNKREFGAKYVKFVFIAEIV